MLLQAGEDVVDLQVGGLDGVPQAIHPAPQLRQFRLVGLKLRPLFADHAVHLLIDKLHEFEDVALREDMVAKLLDDEPLEVLGVQTWCVAAAAAALDEGLAHVVGIAPALGFRGRERPAARLALGEAAEEVGARGAARVDLCRRLGLKHLRYLLELLAGDDGGEGVLHPDGAEAVLRRGPPDQCARVGLVGEHRVDGRLVPPLAPGARDSLGVERPGNVEDAFSLEGHLEDAAHHGVGRRVQFQLLTLAGSVLDRDLPVPMGRDGSDPEATGGRLTQAAHDLLGQVLAVELIDALDDRLHKLARGGVVGVLGDGDDADAASAQHGLEGDGVLALARETGELPDEDLAEGSVGALGGIQHLAELGPIGDAPALRLVNVLADDGVAVLLGVVAQRPELGGDGQVDILAVAGDARIEGGRGWV
ncbi:MAG: hypothetical protein OXH41_13600 [Chloroflexi bacterium]|nr:hypothetical protein [Chloroflexota bacterium]